MAACHCNSFDRGSGIGHRRRPEGRHRQGGHPARGGRLTERDELGVVAFNEAAHWVVQTAAARATSATSRAQIGAIRADGQTNIYRRSRPGGAVARRGHRDPPPHHPADRRLVDLRPVRRDPGQDEGRRDHALDGRRGRRGEPLPRAARDPGRRPVLRRGEPGQHPRHLPQGDPAGLRPADRRGAVLPDPDLVARRSCAASTTVSRSCSATTGRPPSPPPRPCSSRRATIRSSPSGSTASVARSPGRRTPPGAGPRTGSAGAGFNRFFSQLVSWTFPGEETDGIEARFEATDGAHGAARRERGGGRLAARLLLDPRDRGRTGPRAAQRRPCAGRARRLRGAARRGRPGRLRGPGHPDTTGIVGARAHDRAGRADRRRVPPARGGRAVPRRASLGHRRRGSWQRPWIRGRTT